MSRTIVVLACFCFTLCLIPVLAFSQASQEPQTSQEPQAQATPSKAGEDVQEVKDFEDITPTPSPRSGSPGAPLTKTELLGRFHPMVLHFPIAWLMLLFLIDLGTFVFRKADWAKFGYAVLILTLVSFIPAILTGSLLAPHIGATGKVLETLDTHKDLMVAMASVTVVAFLLRALKGNKLEGAFAWVYLCLVVAAVVLITAGGHEGAEVAFGENFLPF
jgi:uncharacterized membrane protein